MLSGAACCANVTESSSPAVSSSDPTISAPTFNGASMRRPFENESWTGGYYDAGALPRQVTSGGGGGPVAQRTTVTNIGTY
jgi:hypothetical protein